MPIVSYLFNILAISIFVPTPSVLATIFGLLKFFGISEIEPKPPMFLNFLRGKTICGLLQVATMQVEKIFGILMECSFLKTTSVGTIKVVEKLEVSMMW